MVRKKKIVREEPDGLCSCLLTSCKSFLPSQSHTSFSLLLHRQRNVKVSEKRTLPASVSGSESYISRTVEGEGRMGSVMLGIAWLGGAQGGEGNATCYHRTPSCLLAAFSLHV